MRLYVFYMCMSILSNRSMDEQILDPDILFDAINLINLTATKKTRTVNVVVPSKINSLQKKKLQILFLSLSFSKTWTYTYV